MQTDYPAEEEQIRLGRVTSAWSMRARGTFSTCSRRTCRRTSQDGTTRGKAELVQLVQRLTRWCRVPLTIPRAWCSPTGGVGWSWKGPRRCLSEGRHGRRGEQRGSLLQRLRLVGHSFAACTSMWIPTSRDDTRICSPARERSTSQTRKEVAVVTGGTSGIGIATARRSLPRGASDSFTGRPREALDAAVAEIGDNHGNRPTPPRWTSRPPLRQAAADKGHIDVLFGNAGGGAMQPLGEITEPRSGHLRP